MYKIVCNDLNVIDCYVGHTTDYVVRKACHKRRCENSTDPKHNLKVYNMMRDHGGWENWSMIEIEKYPCADVNEATTRERYWYEELKATMNYNVPHRSNAEYVKDNAEKYRKKSNEYYHEHKETISEKSKLYRQENLEEVRTKDAIYGTKYRSDNREKVNATSNKYYNAHKEEIQRKANVVFECQCGSSCRHVDKSKHLKTKKHCLYIASQVTVDV